MIISYLFNFTAAAASMNSAMKNRMNKIRGADYGKYNSLLMISMALLDL